MNVFIVFVKFLGLIVAIWVRLARLIGVKGAKVLEGAQLQNEIYNNSKKKKKIWTRPGWALLGPHLGLSLLQKVMTFCWMEKLGW